MKLSSFCDYVVNELMREILGVSARAMFGGYSLYKDGKIFGMIADDVLYFKVKDSNRADYEAAGSKPFTYVNKGKKYSMSYWEVPEEVQSDHEILAKWINKALAI